MHLFFDEMGAWQNLWFGGTSDAWPRIVSSYHCKGWTRDFIKKEYSSSVKEPYINQTIIGQPDTAKKGIKKETK